MTLTEQIAALQEQIPMAGMTVQENGTRVTYPPLSEILKSISKLQRKTVSKRPFSVVPMTSRARL